MSKYPQFLRILLTPFNASQRQNSTVGVSLKVEEKVPFWPQFRQTQAATRCQDAFINFARIRNRITVNPLKTPITITSGDPTVVPGGPRCNYATEALVRAVLTQKHDGYHTHWGGEVARKAVADHFSTQLTRYSSDDVIVTIGGGHGLELVITGLANPGENFLFPEACYRVYETYTRAHEVEFRGYQLTENGLIDLHDLEKKIDNKTRAIMLNNPHNPLGTVYPKTHLEQFLYIAQKHRLPVVSDEIYRNLVFGEEKFWPLTELEPKVPIITLDALSKSYLVPGWRCGWLLLRDHEEALSQVWEGMHQLCYKAVGAASVIEGALPDILKNTPQSFFDELNERLAKNANLFYNLLKKVPGLRPIMPQAAIYMCVQIDKTILGDELDFIKGLVEEEAVTAMPGSYLGLPGYFRAMLLLSEEVIIDTCNRISEYSQRRIAKRNGKITQ